MSCPSASATSPRPHFRSSEAEVLPLLPLVCHGQPSPFASWLLLWSQGLPCAPLGLARSSRTAGAPAYRKQPCSRIQSLTESECFQPDESAAPLPVTLLQAHCDW